METQKINTNKIHTDGRAYLLPINQKLEEAFEINEFLTIGRDFSNTITINDPFVSCRHVRIEKQKRGGYLLRDTHSLNGTFLNGVAVNEAYLANSDKLMIGESLFIFSEFNYNPKTLKSKNKSWNKQLKRLPVIANTEHTVLVMGPSGSGKEVLSCWIHENSKRKAGPYVAINCSALGENLIESELFGHTRGAFTGATENRKGAFEAARGGTLFLDEIGDLPFNLQPKLLRALENKVIRPVGSDRDITTNVRIIAATHKNLKLQVFKGEFREDLFHRLDICRLTPPSLINRMEDFESLLYEFAQEQKVSFSYPAIEKLKNHSWPGNIRELKNVITRAGAYFPGRRVNETELNQVIPENGPIGEEDFFTYSGRSATLPPVQEIEKDIIVRELRRNAGNQLSVARELKIAKSTLNDKLRRYRINPQIFKRKSGIL